MPNLLYQHDVISVNDLSQSQVQLVLKTAKQFKEKKLNPTLENKIIAHCFFEPSTRTRLSFETATHRLSGKVIGFSSDEGLSVKKGETLNDTIRVISEYADLIILRHPQEGAARLAAEVSAKPIINAGDGANQHPTQALVDLFTIQECQDRIEGIHIGLVGDLKYGRTIHSLTQLCTLFNVRLYLVSPDELSLPESVCDQLKKKGVRFSFHKTLEEIIPKCDILYFTRIQKERLGDIEFQSIKNNFILNAKLLKLAKSNLKVLHPLPRLDEIALSVDQTPFAHYFEQSANGVCVRQALLTLLLNEEFND